MIPFILYNDTVLDASERRVLLEGMDLKRFEANAPILLEHGWGYSFPIGKWHNVRKDGNQLLADAEFDEDDEVAKFVKGKVERGFMNGASIGAKVAEWSEQPEHKLPKQRQATAIKSELMEASIVTIGDNPAALKQVIEKSFKKGGRSLNSEIYTFKNIQNEMEIIKTIQDTLKKGFESLSAELKAMQPKEVTLEDSTTEIEIKELDLKPIEDVFKGLETSLKTAFEGFNNEVTELKTQIEALKENEKAFTNDIAELKTAKDGSKGRGIGDKAPFEVAKTSDNVTQLGSMSLIWE